MSESESERPYTQRLSVDERLHRIEAELQQLKMQVGQVIQGLGLGNPAAAQVVQQERQQPPAPAAAQTQAQTKK